VSVARTIAAATPDGSLFGHVLPWLVALLGVVLVGGTGIWLVRRVARHDLDGGAGGFTLHDLRGLKASGQLSDAEFTRARDSLIGRLSEPSGAEHEQDGSTGS
jgi:hypothetical protein